MPDVILGQVWQYKYRPPIVGGKLLMIFRKIAFLTAEFEQRGPRIRVEYKMTEIIGVERFVQGQGLFDIVRRFPRD